MRKGLLRIIGQDLRDVRQLACVQKYFLLLLIDTLYAEINMLGHEDLRKEIAQGIQDKFLAKYEEMLLKIGKDKMDNEEVKTFCK